MIALGSFLPLPPHTHNLRQCLPQTKREGESAEEFAVRVQRMIADRAQLKIVPW